MHSIDKTSAATITDFDGQQVKISIGTKVIRDALHIVHQGLSLPMGNLTASERRAAFVKERPTFNELRHPKIRRALQLYMQHFNLSLAQRYTRPEIRIASLLTKAYEDEDLIAYDVSPHVLKAIQCVKEQKTSIDASQAQRKLPPFLGGALMLTRIAYQAIGKIDQLPPPLDEDNNIQFHQKPYRQKANPDKADKRKRDSTDSATGSQAKKMRGQLSRADTDEEKKETQRDSHDDQQEPSEESDEDRTQFNVDDFLSTLEEIPASLKTSFWSRGHCRIQCSVGSSTARIYKSGKGGKEKTEGRGPH